ncbi:4Fe-4S ferredoxin, iron-sulfur binding protein [Cordyceps militaris CM01]|uniref:4Fe-4S ferredoxin, iron-sulfur binding protein n=1 Tax=Cordyceps militaris (strain CM01) TaxID=983644 RepID=G3JSX1_CORMM|nr:4Fe-4S ferredoxin, iron-sulfur binding protein [Cordyceps militaris CM01]EGX88967.1 4Fe-4S ferredoxin, iron-sulfur binding protein [Cordyceps militaris CM01]
MSQSDNQDETFELYDLKVEVVCPPGERILCGAKAGDYFTLEGELLSLPPGQSISIYSLGRLYSQSSFLLPFAFIFPSLAACYRAADCSEASVLPLLPAKQRVTHKNDWMTTDALVACPDPSCPSKLRITRTGIRTFTHAETTAVGLQGN